MKLINKFTIWYLSITLVVILIGGCIAYYKVKKEIDQAEIIRLKNLNDKIAVQMQSGDMPYVNTTGRPVEITAIDSTITENQSRIMESSFYNTDTRHNECRLTVQSFYHIGDKNYRISSYNYVTKANEILIGLVDSLVWILLLLLLLLAISARLVSNAILQPFYKTLKAIQVFGIKKREPIYLSATRTREFNELNSFLGKMTDKVLEDYHSLKEFSENASHELQTPLAIMRSKLELLAESEITREQALLIGDMQKGIEKLSRINQSLLLLNKLENHEYQATKDIPFCRITNEVIAGFEELIEIKSLQLTTSVDKHIELTFHPALADILVNNLLSNAIRHNIPNGRIELLLTEKSLLVKNTGNPPQVPTDQLFQRFRKGNQNDDSIGIGLAIVKQICDINQFRVSYHYSDGWHALEVQFV